MPSPQTGAAVVVVVLVVDVVVDEVLVVVVNWVLEVVDEVLVVVVVLGGQGFGEQVDVPGSIPFCALHCASSLTRMQ